MHFIQHTIRPFSSNFWTAFILGQYIDCFQWHKIYEKPGWASLCISQRQFSLLSISVLICTIGSRVWAAAVVPWVPPQTHRQRLTLDFTKVKPTTNITTLKPTKVKSHHKHHKDWLDGKRYLNHHSGWLLCPWSEVETQIIGRSNNQSQENFISYFIFLSPVWTHLHISNKYL